MKRSIIPYIFLCLLLFSSEAPAQNPSFCSCDVNLEPINPCCAKLQIFLPAGCSGTGITEIAVDASIGSWPGDIQSVAGIGGVTATKTGTRTAIFTSSSTFDIPANLGVIVDVGEICFSDVTAPVVTPQIELKNLNGVTVCIDYAEFQANCPKPTDWKKLYGSTADEKPEKVKVFGDGLYVLKSKDLPGGPYASIAKFDVTSGALLWDRHLNTPSEFTDFDYYAETGELFVVGATIPSQAGGVSYDNKSILVRYDVNGNLMGEHIFDMTGRELFEEVLIHPYPEDIAKPIYILGRKNPVGLAPDPFDVTVLLNVNKFGVVNWIKEYPEVSNIELETFRGLAPLRNGDLMVVGNGTINNPGALINLDGLSGSFISGFYYQDRIDVYNAVEMPSGDVILAGTDFGNNQGLLLVTDGAPNFNVLSGLRYGDVSTFRDIWRDQYDNVYVVERLKAAAPGNFPIVHSLQYDAGSHTLSQNFRRYIEDIDTDYSNPHIFVSPAHDRIFYADARVHSNGFGLFDLLVGSYDLELSCECMDEIFTGGQPYTINKISFTCFDNTIADPSLLTTFGHSTFADNCITFCGPPNPPLFCDFTFNVDCFEVTFNGSATGGTGPYTFQWDLDFPGGPAAFGQNVLYSYPTTPNPGTYTVQMTVTDASGQVCTKQQTVTVQDLDPPVLQCPTDLTITTDPGECFATFEHGIAVTDDCDDNPSLSCVITGATTGDETTTRFNKGVSTIKCYAQDQWGNIDSCIWTITVVDQELPTISNCPGNLSTTVPGCEAGSVMSWTPPTVTDNCPMVTLTSTHNPGDFFPCGTTTVTYTATDMAGNVATCSFQVTVNCLCAEIVSTSMSCKPEDPLSQDFTLQLNSLLGVPNPDLSCSVGINWLTPNATLTNVAIAWSGTLLTVTGTATFTDGCTPDNLILRIDQNCACPNNPNTSCSTEVILTPECCKSISLEDQMVCKDGPTRSISIVDCDLLCDVQQVRYYVSDAPCPAPGTWGVPFQVTTTCQPLVIDPRFHNGDICVYAEVVVGGGDGPCEGIFTTNVATIKLCEPVGCSLSAPQEYCYTGSPITPTGLTVGALPANPDCPFTIQWFDDNGPIAGATGPTYQPPALSLPSGSQDCSQTFTYRVEISSECGVQACSTTIRLDNEAAPNGTLDMFPAEALPFCPGEDATLRYQVECAEPEEWHWFISQDNFATVTPITTAGDRNPLYNTNRLYQDTWYRVEKQNGVCPVDQIDYYIPVNPSLSITSFQALGSPVCDPTSVKMIVDFTPVLTGPCDYTIRWYRNGQLLHTSTAQSGPIAWSWIPPSPPNGIAGNYYVTVSNNCCSETLKSPVVTVDPPCDIAILGPCFRCKEETVDLTGVLINPIAGASCTFQWYDENGPISGATGTMLTVQPSQTGPFIFESKCLINGATCVKADTFYLQQCGTNNTALCPDLSVDDIPIADGTYQAGALLTSEGEVYSGSNVTFKAAGTISLQPGFRAYAGSSFQAQIEDCVPEVAVLEEPNLEIEEGFPIGKLNLKVFPNPFQSRTTIRYEIPAAASVQISIYDIYGRVVDRPVPGVQQEEGIYDVYFHAKNLPSGIYLVVVQTEDEREIRRVEVVR